MYVCTLAILNIVIVVYCRERGNGVRALRTLVKRWCSQISLPISLATNKLHDGGEKIHNGLSFKERGGVGSGT